MCLVSAERYESGLPKMRARRYSADARSNPLLTTSAQVPPCVSDWCLDRSARPSRRR